MQDHNYEDFYGFSFHYSRPSGMCYDAPLEEKKDFVNKMAGDCR